MTKLVTEIDTHNIESIILDIVHMFNRNYGNNVDVSSEFDINALLNTVSFNVRNSKTTKIDTYDLYNTNSYMSFNNNEYEAPVEDKPLLEKIASLQKYCGTEYTKNPINYLLSKHFVLLDDDVFHPSKVVVNSGKVIIYGTVNRELLKAEIKIGKDNKLKIKGRGTEVFVGHDNRVKYSDYAMQYLKDLFGVIDLDIKKINYKPFYPVITVVKRGE